VRAHEKRTQASERWEIVRCGEANGHVDSPAKSRTRHGSG
jgi:hypothetical protein